MATSLTTSRRGTGGKHLYCGVCRDVFRSPRLLPCFHTFCVHCIEGLIRQYGGIFPCPQCRKSTPVPLQIGALGFQLNFYITEEELELERNGPSVAMCPTHEVEPLLFFCGPCDQPICIRCKLTKHDHHETEDLSDAAARCEGRLGESKDRLEDTITFLTRKSAEAHENLEAARLKDNAIKEEVQARRDALVARVDKWRDAVLEEVNQSSKRSENQLSDDAKKIQQELDSLLQLRQRVHHALSEASDAEKVSVEKEMRQGQGSDLELAVVERSVPVSTVRTGLHCDQAIISDEDIHRYLGSPVQLTLPSVAPPETIVPIYRCGEDGQCREVHDVCHVDDSQIYVSYGGTGPDYEGERQISVAYMRRTNWSGFQGKGKVSFRKKYESNAEYYRYKQMSNGEYELSSKGFKKSGGTLIITAQPAAGQCCISKLTRPSVPVTGKGSMINVKRTTLFDVESGKPTAFDSTTDGQLFAVVEEKSTDQPDVDGGRRACLNLFHRGQRKPFATYSPSDASFHPADICFWTENGEEKLLVADPQNDSVHVVKIEDDSCHFERYLAAGNGHLARPTALDVDCQDRVWIGCGNGWILRCEKRPDDEDRGSSVDRDEADDASTTSEMGSVAGRPLLVENSSRTTDALSSVSDD